MLKEQDIKITDNNMILKKSYISNNVNNSFPLIRLTKLNFIEIVDYIIKWN